ncbi:MAG: ABC transporter permease [Candidatus Riflebacteria bacterium]|nr:ABC transporter permease [Candidatus Riflebacteria bacterium]
MKISSLIRGSLTQFRGNLVRTLLTLLGIVFGVASVIAMITVGEGAQQQILENIRALGADLVQIQSVQMDDAQISRVINDSQGLSERDVRAISRVLPMEGRDLAWMGRVPVKVSSLPIQSCDLQVFAVSPLFLQVHKLKLLSGRSFQSDDFREERSVILVSQEYSRRFFGESPKLDSIFVRLNQQWFRVIGIFGKDAKIDEKMRKSVPIDPGRFSQAIIMPFPTAGGKLFPPKIYGELEHIAIKCRSLQETTQVKAIADRVLGASHHGIADFRIVAPQELLEQQRATQRIFNIVLLCIASISLLVGGIGIMNIMLANVLERRSEIGIRRALGAKKRHIIAQFLLESVLVCLIGGVIGVATGVGIGLGIRRFTEIPITFTLRPILVSFGISFLIGVIFGIMPARKAANLNPIEALHNE